MLNKKNDNFISKNIKTIRNMIETNKEAVHFLLKFCIITILFFAVFYVTIGYFEGLLIGTAWLAGTLANLFGMSVTINGSLINIGSMNLEIIPECTGIFALFVTIACILSYPADIKKKVVGILLIIPFIFLLNLFRLLILILVGKYYIDIFEYVHSYLWQATFLIFIILGWFLWIELVVKK